jgi:hypothetical protein
MHEHHSPAPLQFREDGLEASIPEVDPVCVREQHHTIELERIEGVGQLVQSAIDVRQRQGGKAALPFGCACTGFAESSLQRRASDLARASSPTWTPRRGNRGDRDVDAGLVHEREHQVGVPGRRRNAADRIVRVVRLAPKKSGRMW